MLETIVRVTPYGISRETPFVPPYDRQDWVEMQTKLDNATLMGLAAVRFIHSDRVTVTTTGEAIA